MTALTRREFLAATLASTVTPAWGQAESLDLAFFLVGDTHYLARQPNQLDPISAGTNSRLVDHLNRLPGTAIPQNAGGGTVLAPRGLIHAGDLIDSGDRSGGVFPQLHQTEWTAFTADYGLTGKDGRLKYPVYEVHGNHDSPGGDGLVIKGIIERNRARPGLANVARNGLHYSWDWGPVHFVNLGIVVGAVKEVERRRRFDPLDSLDFLISDLAEKVGQSGRPVVLTHHIDVARHSTPPNPGAPAVNAEWDPADVRGYYQALQAYNVIAVLYGHTHARNVFRWNGTPQRAPQGVPVFNVDNGAHFGSAQQAIFYFHLRGDELIVRELATADRWETAAWTPQTWTTKLALPKG